MVSSAVTDSASQHYSLLLAGWAALHVLGLSWTLGSPCMVPGRDPRGQELRGIRPCLRMPPAGRKQGLWPRMAPTLPAQQAQSQEAPGPGSGTELDRAASRGWCGPWHPPLCPGQKGTGTCCGHPAQPLWWVVVWLGLESWFLCPEPVSLLPDL